MTPRFGCGSSEAWSCCLLSLERIQGKQVWSGLGRYQGCHSEHVKLERYSTIPGGDTEHACVNLEFRGEI